MTPLGAETAEGDQAGCITLLSLTIPDGKSPGETFTYTDDDGLELEITVPADGKAGETMEILIDNDDDEIETVEVSLGPHIDVTLTMVTFIDDGEDLEEDEEDDNKEEAAEEDDKKKTVVELSEEQEDDIGDDEDFDGTNFMVWPAGIELAQFLASPFAKLLIADKKNALELGSGCGVSGMALTAALARVGEDSANTKVTLTDLPLAMSLLSANFEENKEKLVVDSGVQAATAPFTWGSEEDAKKLGKGSFDLIIGADLIYNAEDEVVNKLSSSIDSLLDQKGTIIFSARWRKFDEERKFFEKMEELGYEFDLVKSRITELGGVTTLEEGDEKKEDAYKFLDTMCELSWKEFGNKESNASEKYFSETKFKASDDEEKCLKDIDEEDLAIMADADFDDCELAFIQIYAGRKKA